MLKSIKEFFRSSMSPPGQTEPKRSRKDIRLAACALLLELAHADDEFTEDERQHLMKLPKASEAATVRLQWDEVEGRDVAEARA